MSSELDTKDFAVNRIAGINIRGLGWSGLQNQVSRTEGVHKDYQKLVVTSEAGAKRFGRKCARFSTLLMWSGDEETAEKLQELADTLREVEG